MYDSPRTLKNPILLLLSAFAVAGCSSDNLFEPNNATGLNTIRENTTAPTTETDAGTGLGTDAGSEVGTITGAETEVGSQPPGTGGENIPDNSTVGAANCSALTSSGTLANIAGLYDFTFTTDDGLEDVYYAQIFENGTITLYDYQQDDIDQGDSCYYIYSGYNVISPLGNDEFVLTSYINPDDNCETYSQQGIIIRSATQLSSTFQDIEDVDYDGDTTELITEFYPLLSGVTPDSFNRCE